METRSAQEIWEAALGELQIQVSKPNYRTWLEKTEGLSYQDNQFIVSVPNTFVAEYLDRNQRSLIEKVLAGIINQRVQVQFQVSSNHDDLAASYEGKGKTISAQQAKFPLFNPKYTFNSFVVGSCNQLAYTAAQGVAQNPGHSYNPLFIYGGAGLGKTHLLQATGNRIAELFPNKTVKYTTSERFISRIC